MLFGSSLGPYPITAQKPLLQSYKPNRSLPDTCQFNTFDICFWVYVEEEEATTTTIFRPWQLDLGLLTVKNNNSKRMTSVSGYGCCYSRTANYNHSLFSLSNSTICKKWRRRIICFTLEESEPIQHLHLHHSLGNENAQMKQPPVKGRRQLLSFISSSVGLGWMTAASAAPRPDYADMPALRGKDYGKTKMRYPDYTLTDSGLQYKDLRAGDGPTPKLGDTVVVDWDGYTIGYYGRIFEARNKTKGGSFEGNDKDFFKFKVGSEEVIPAFEEAISGMTPGSVRRIIVPPELGYPDYDYDKKGPRPTTFSGQRALSFVLRNQGLIDKTLLFDIELLKIIPS